MNLCELTPPPVEHDRDVMKLESIITGLRSMRPHMKAIGDALAGTQAAGLADRVASVSERCNVERAEHLSIAAECIEEAGIALTDAMDAEPIQIDRADVARDQYTEDRIDERLIAIG